ncbi:thioredoxin-dependent thiol peroxidase [Saliterribacillus persicus]|uniref:thioredoxin-dependent peroxiredoxin n=1 Tax=Saliterribacillus persicus TaxID=930114 RepID=A0A368X981_9BACI|nr:thioredoxin-dependent thiol peroxidase [Saliterribacillus persicus]RCW62594.1 peroxiredoxin Q/BCP [Saliterribacillus persicus]
MTVEVGQKVNDFTLKNNSGETVNLSDYAGKHVVLYFYPKDDTPGCTTEACDFRDNYESFKELDAVILGISPDSEESHKKFIDKHDLPFELLVDTDKEVAEQFGVWQKKNKFGKEYMGIVRSTFIIDKEGVLQKEYRNVQVKGHVDNALNYIKDELN